MWPPPVLNSLPASSFDDILEQFTQNDDYVNHDYNGQTWSFPEDVNGDVSTFTSSPNQEQGSSDDGHRSSSESSYSSKEGVENGDLLEDDGCTTELQETQFNTVVNFDEKDHSDEVPDNEVHGEGADTALPDALDEDFVMYDPASVTEREGSSLSRSNTPFSRTSSIGKQDKLSSAAHLTGHVRESNTPPPLQTAYSSQPFLVPATTPAHASDFRISSNLICARRLLANTLIHLPTVSGKGIHFTFPRTPAYYIAVLLSNRSPTSRTPTSSGDYIWLRGHARTTVRTILAQVRIATMLPEEDTRLLFGRERVDEKVLVEEMDLWGVGLVCLCLVKRGRADWNGSKWGEGIVQEVIEID